MRRILHSVACGSTVAWGWSGALVVACALTAPASAQNDVLNELYGSGVHAYNSGYVREAYSDLTMAIRSGSKDPRVYYYRGLSYIRLGRPQEAQADFKKGAALEMADTDRFYPVSKSLERIQGQARAQIERYRSSARLVAYQSRERKRYERYERIRKNEPNVLMPPEEATEMPAPANEPAKPPAAEPTEPEPAEPEPAEPEPAEPEPAEPEPAMPAEKPDADDPFAEDGKQEPADEIPAEKADADSDDPFAEKGDDEMPAEEMPDDEKPAEEVTEEGDDEMPAEDADEKPDEEKPAEEKPADEKPADDKQPADDDPFGSK